MLFLNRGRRRWDGVGRVNTLIVDAAALDADASFFSGSVTIGAFSEFSETQHEQRTKLVFVIMLVSPGVSLTLLQAKLMWFDLKRRILFWVWEKAYHSAVSDTSWSW